MALDFHNSPADKDIHTDSLNQRWQYDSSTNSWTVLGGTLGHTGDVVVDGKTLTFENGLLTKVA